MPNAFVLYCLVPVKILRVFKEAPVLNVTRTSSARRLVVLAAVLIAVFGSAFALSAQTAAKKVLTVDDYTKWRSITASEISGRSGPELPMHVVQP